MADDCSIPKHPNKIRDMKIQEIHYKKYKELFPAQIIRNKGFQ